MNLVPVLLAISSGVLVQSESAVQELRALAVQGDDSTLTARVAAWPDEAREAIRQLLLLAASPAPTTEVVAHLNLAERIATAFSKAWRDPFQLRQVGVFRNRSPADRRTFVVADSILREGNSSVFRDGVAVAMGRWAEALRHFNAIHDSAGMASASGNMGWGFNYTGSPDSARGYLARAGALAETIGDLRVAGNTAAMQGLLAYERGDLLEASERHTRAMELHQRVGNFRGVAADHNNVGMIADELGDRDAARRSYEAALALNREHDNPSRAADNLVNLGALASVEGDYDGAARHYREALSVYRELDEPVSAALALHNLGLLDIRRGDYPSALNSLEESLAIYEGTGGVAEAVSVRRTMAMVQAAMGDLQRALGDLRTAEHAVRDNETADPALLAGLALAQADLALQFNQLSEAEREYGRATRFYREADDPRGQAEAQQGQGNLALLRQDFAGSRDVLALTLRSQENARDARSASWTRVLLASALQELGDTAEARRNLEEAVVVFRRLGDPVSEATALGAQGDLEVQNGMALRAELLYHQALRLMEQRPVSTVSWVLHAGLARALKSRGALDESAGAFRRAIREIESMSGTVPVEERRAAFLADKWEVFQDLALVELARRRPQAAFEVSERMRARQMLDLLARGRVSVNRSVAPELLAQEQDLRRRIGELTTEFGTGDLTSLRGPGDATRDLNVVREALSEAHQQYAALLLHMREAAPEYADVVTGRVATARDVMNRLAPDQAMLEFLLGDSTSVVFVVTADTVAALDLNVDRRTVVNRVGFVRGVLARPVGVSGRDLWRAPMRRLYEQLLEPVEQAGLLRGKRRLLIASHGELHYLPFDALVVSGDRREFLIERYQVANVPSASVWVQLQERSHAGVSRRVLALAPRDRALPGSREEAEAIDEIFDERATVLMGADATEARLVRDASEYGIVHLASYGILNKHNPLFSFIELNAEDEDDGRLEVHEVFDLDLNARLVVLSACRTGLGSGALADVPAGDDWVGLVRAILYAGASNVVATIWPVEDRATATLMKLFYRSLESGADLTDALSRAKRAALQDPATAHPFYWAGFVLVGEL